MLRTSDVRRLTEMHVCLSVVFPKLNQNCWSLQWIIRSKITHGSWLIVESLSCRSCRSSSYLSKCSWFPRRHENSLCRWRGIYSCKFSTSGINAQNKATLYKRGSPLLEARTIKFVIQVPILSIRFIANIAARGTSITPLSVSSFLWMYPSLPFEQGSRSELKS